MPGHVCTQLRKKHLLRWHKPRQGRRQRGNQARGGEAAGEATGRALSAPSSWAAQGRVGEG
eukprot:939963-Lingulodinium_polyedra.AAC.1